MPELIAAHDAFMQEHRRCLTYYNGTQISGETDEEAEEREARRRETVFRTRSKKPQSIHLIQVRVAGANGSSQNIVSKR